MTSIQEKNMSVLTDQFIRMTQLLLRQISLLQDQISGDNSNKITEEITENENIMDSLEVSIHDESVEIISLMSPRAGDLRRIIACLDMSRDIERTSDLICSISRRLIFLIHSNSIFEYLHKDIMLIYETSSKMIQNAIFAFECEDNDIARNVIDSDDNVDNLNNEIQKKLFAFNQCELDQIMIRDVLETGRILYNIERIGDCATNIAEAIIFMTEGKDIKHENKKNISCR